MNICDIIATLKSSFVRLLCIIYCNKLHSIIYTLAQNMLVTKTFGVTRWELYSAFFIAENAGYLVWFDYSTNYPQSQISPCNKISLRVGRG